MIQKIILASQSPRRKQLLELAGISFDVIVQPTDETFPTELNIEDVPEYIALQKALAVKNYIKKEHINYSETPIVAADTIVVLENKIIGKPKNRLDAIEILQSLSNKKHNVITGVVVLIREEQICFSDTTEVVFNPLTLLQIEYYVDNFKPYDKAGAYAIQEWIGLIGVKSIHGDYYNVMGLPVNKVVHALEKIFANKLI